ncbi:LOW QUALITY PROTEIN: serine/threonine-protein kinase 31 [Cyanocitta cristata]
MKKTGVLLNVRCPPERLSAAKEERDELIIKDEVQQNLYSVLTELISEVDQLPLSEHSRALQIVVVYWLVGWYLPYQEPLSLPANPKPKELTASLEMMYGQNSEADDSGVTSYRRHVINYLLSIKKTVKSLKAQLRWKLFEKNNFETLCIQTQEFGIKEDETPEDDKVKSLLLNLFCCNRLMPEQVLRNDCFLTVDAIPVSLQAGEEYETHEKQNSEKTGGKKKVINQGKWSKPYSIDEKFSITCLFETCFEIIDLI